MRTKTILLSGVVAALTSASLMAQVYSLNAVGYINVTIPPGFSIIANQLNTTNNNLSPLLDSQINPYGVSGLNLCVFYKFNNATATYTTLNPDYFSVNTIPWDQTIASNTTLNPGEAVFVRSFNTTNVTVTFVGTVLQGPLTNTTIAGPGFNLISSMVPQAGRLDLDLGLPEVDNDDIYVYNASNTSSPQSENLGYINYFGDEFSSTGQPWDVTPFGGQPLNPTVAVGQGFFYRGFQTGSAIGNAGNGGPTYTTGGYSALWTRTFNVN